MLAHLHELQSENRKMKARIMELASQREFFIATNAHLRQSLSEGGINKVINGIQLLSDGTLSASLAGINSNRGTWVEQPAGGESTNSMDVESVAATTPGHGGVGHHHSSGGPVGGNSSQASFPDNHHSLSSSTHSHSSRSSFSSMDSHSWSVHLPSGVHEVTHVTNSVQGPISTYTTLPSLPGSSSTSHMRITD